MVVTFSNKYFPKSKKGIENLTFLKMSDSRNLKHFPEKVRQNRFRP
jgi:hypothetical protein